MIETTHIGHIGLVKIGYMLIACMVLMVLVPVVEWLLERDKRITK